jgi:flagellar biosynthesis chaperone FliJ
MKGLVTLIKLHRRNLDQLRKKIVDTERQKNLLLLVAEKLANELASELEVASTHSYFGNFFGNYAERIKKRQEDVAREIINLEQMLHKLAEELSEGFSELKKFEIAQENRLKRQKEEADRKEQIRLDDIAIDQFTRKEQ